MRFQSSKSIFVFVLLVSHLTAYHLGNAVNGKPKSSSENTAPQIKKSFFDDRPKREFTEKIKSKTKLKKPEQKALLPVDLTNNINLKNVIKKIHPNQLNNYLSKYFEPQDLEKISDHEAFAERLIDLYTGDETSEEIPYAPKAEIAIHTNEQYPLEKLDLFSIEGNTRLYAHLKLDDSANLLSEVFVKWERIGDNKLLLFEKKLFNSTSYHNWVSIMPQGGWKIGEYHVSFYQFDSKMRKIAGYTYFLSEVTDTPES